MSSNEELILKIAELEKIIEKLKNEKNEKCICGSCYKCCRNSLKYSHTCCICSEHDESCCCLQICDECGEEIYLCNCNCLSGDIDCDDSVKADTEHYDEDGFFQNKKRCCHRYTAYYGEKCRRCKKEQYLCKCDVKNDTIPRYSDAYWQSK
jgi:hypothetical protein